MTHGLGAFPRDLLECRRCHLQWGTLGAIIPSACPNCYLEDWIMTPDDRDKGNWQRATEVDPETLLRCRDVVIEFLTLHGRPPTAVEMQRALAHPGR